jgi:microcystin-dependent protein
MNNILSAGQKLQHISYNVLPMIHTLFKMIHTHVGEYKWSSRTSDFGGWLLCDGRTITRADFPELYDVIAESYGPSPDGTFKLPDMRGRVMGAVGEGEGLTIRAMGANVGTEMHALSIDELPTHAHGGYTDSNGLHSHGGTTSSNGEHTHATNAVGGHGFPGLCISNGANTTDGDTDSVSINEINLMTAPIALTVANNGLHAHTINSDGSHNHNVTTYGVGSNVPHNNMQPTLFAGCVFIFSGKLDVIVPPLEILG